MYNRTLYVSLSCEQSIFSQLKLTPNLKKVLFATALGSVALALTAHQLKRRGRKRKQAIQAKEGQKAVGIPDVLLKTGRPSSLKRGVITKNNFSLELTGYRHLLGDLHNRMFFPLYRSI